MKVPMLDLSMQYRYLKNAIDEALGKVMHSSTFILGENVRMLEQSIAAYSHTKYGIGVANGSDALHISLTACGVGSGDEVITTAFTFFATAGSIVRTGAKPVFVDIQPHTFNIDPGLIEEKITPKTKAIVPVHLYGQVADMEAVALIAKKYGLYIIEDGAQAIGAAYRGCRVGRWGDATCFSFFPTKNLGAFGDAGMIVTNDPELAEKMRIIRTHGSKHKYIHDILGYNSRLDELQAAILNVKFPYLDSWNRLRREKALYYTSMLEENVSNAIVTPYEKEGNYHIYHQYTIRANRRDELQSYLQTHGISTIVYYPLPLHLQPVFSDLGYKEGDLPHTERAAKEVLSLPIFPELSESQQDYVVSKIVAFYKN